MISYYTVANLWLIRLLLEADLFLAGDTQDHASLVCYKGLASGGWYSLINLSSQLYRMIEALHPIKINCFCLLGLHLLELRAATSIMICFVFWPNLFGGASISINKRNIQIQFDKVDRLPKMNFLRSLDPKRYDLLVYGHLPHTIYCTYTRTNTPAEWQRTSHVTHEATTAKITP